MVTTYYIPTNGASIVSVKNGINIVRGDYNGGGGSTNHNSTSSINKLQKPVEVTKSTVMTKTPIGVTPKSRGTVYTGNSVVNQRVVPNYIQLASQKREVPNYVDTARNIVSERTQNELTPKVSTKPSFFADIFGLSDESKRISELANKRQFELATAQREAEYKSVGEMTYQYGVMEKQKETAYRSNLIMSGVGDPNGTSRKPTYIDMATSQLDISPNVKTKIENEVRSQGLFNINSQRSTVDTTNKKSVNDFNSKLLQAESIINSNNEIIAITNTRLDESRKRTKLISKDINYFYSEQMQISSKAQQSTTQLFEANRLNVMAEENKVAFREMGKGNLSFFESGKTISKAVGLGGLQIVYDTASVVTRPYYEYKEDIRDYGKDFANTRLFTPAYYNLKSIYDWDKNGGLDLAPVRGITNIATFGLGAMAGLSTASLTSSLTSKAISLSFNQKLLLGGMASFPVAKLGIATAIKGDFWGNLADTTTEYSYMAGQVGLASAGYNVGKLLAKPLELKFSIESKSVTNTNYPEKGTKIVQKGRITSNYKDNLRYELATELKPTETGSTGRYAMNIFGKKNKLLSKEIGDLTRVSKIKSDTDTGNIRFTEGRDIYTVSPVNKNSRSLVRDFMRLEDSNKSIFVETKGNQGLLETFTQSKSNIKVKEVFKEKLEWIKLGGKDISKETRSILTISPDSNGISNTFSMSDSKLIGKSKQLENTFTIFGNKKGQLALPNFSGINSAETETIVKPLDFAVSRSTNLATSVFLPIYQSKPMFTAFALFGSTTKAKDTTGINVLNISTPVTMTNTFSGTNTFSQFMSKPVTMADMVSFTGLGTTEIFKPTNTITPNITPIIPIIPINPIPNIIEFPDINFGRGGGSFGSLFIFGKINTPKKRYVSSIMAGQLGIFGKMPKTITGLETRPLIRGKHKW